MRPMPMPAPIADSPAPIPAPCIAQAPMYSLVKPVAACRRGTIVISEFSELMVGSSDLADEHRGQKGKDEGLNEGHENLQQHDAERHPDGDGREPDAKQEHQADERENDHV